MTNENKEQRYNYKVYVKDGIPYYPHYRYDTFVSPVGWCFSEHEMIKAGANPTTMSLWKRCKHMELK